MRARVLFVGVGLTHYYNQVLNRLQADLGIEIHDVVAREGEGHAGAGVFQTEDDVGFHVLRLREFTLGPYYRSFHGLARAISSLRPEIVVTSPDYLKAFAFDPLLRAARGRCRSGLVLKSIPFQVPRREELAASIARSRRPTLGRVFLALETAAFRAPDAHACYVDEAVALYGSYGVPASKIFVTRNSPDTDRLFLARERIAGVPPILPPNPHRIVHVGRLIPWKRVDLLIEALAAVRTRLPDAELVVVGDGPERAALEARAARAGLAEAVRFVGGVYAPEELGRYLAASAVYVLAGMGGLSINDAMCFGKPVICSVCDGTERHLVRDGENGLYFEAGDVESLARAILRLLEAPGLVERMGERSTEIIQEEINIHTVVEGYGRAFAAARRAR